MSVLFLPLPGTGRFQTQRRVDPDPAADHAEAVAIHQNLGNQVARIVGRGHRGAIGPGVAEGQSESSFTASVRVYTLAYFRGLANGQQHAMMPRRARA